jgi:DNA-binding GntR family transcriptional regulator
MKIATRPSAFAEPHQDPSMPSPAAGENGETRMQRQLADAIYEHRLPPGTKLPEVELCRIFGVTRGVVRKVLNRLAAEELLDLIPNRGAFVARPSVDETRDVYELRRILEAGVVRGLARHAPHRWIDELRRQVAEEREANRVGDTPRYIRLAGKFHLDLVAATGNAALEQHLKRVVSRTSLMVALYDVPGTNTCSFHEHLEILVAIEAGDYARAERLMEEHLLGCERQLRLGGEPQRVDLEQALGAVSEGPPGRRQGAARRPWNLPAVGS